MMLSWSKPFPGSIIEECCRARTLPDVFKTKSSTPVAVRKWMTLSSLPAGRSAASAARRRKRASYSIGNLRDAIRGGP